MSTGSMVEEGMAVGIIVAQSINEPGTQLTADLPLVEQQYVRRR